MLIGDPKQAIYAFRGADVHTYLDAVGPAGAWPPWNATGAATGRWSARYDELFAGIALGDTESATARSGRGRQRAGRGCAVRRATPRCRVRIVQRDDGRSSGRRTGVGDGRDGRREVAADVAADIAGLLASPAEIVGRDADGRDGRTRPIGPGDVAVLVPTHRELAAIRTALEAAGVPAVVAGSRSVFGAPVARDWRAARGVGAPGLGPSGCALVALTPFIGWPAERVATAGDAEWDVVHVHVHEWAALLRRRGVAALAEAVSHAENLPARCSGPPTGSVC